MKNYARIEEQRVVEMVSLSVEPSTIYHPSLEWVDITSSSSPPEIGYIYSDGIFTAPVIEPENAILIAEMTFNVLMQDATKSIAPLQDAVDINMATEDEFARLAEWKKYRVLLSRVNTKKAPDIDWPVKPGQ